jgi:hypothetical protein
VGRRATGRSSRRRRKERHPAPWSHAPHRTSVAVGHATRTAWRSVKSTQGAWVGRSGGATHHGDSEPRSSDPVVCRSAFSSEPWRICGARVRSVARKQGDVDGSAVTELRRVSHTSRSGAGAERSPAWLPHRSVAAAFRWFASVSAATVEALAKDEPRSSRQTLTSRLLCPGDARVRRPRDVALGPRPERAFDS